MSRRSELILRAVLLLIIISLAAAVVCLALVPPVSKDALVHHLAVPRLYLEEGRIFEIPSMPYSYYPMNLELLYLASLYLGSDIAPKLIHFLFALMTGLVIYLYLVSRRGRSVGMLGAVLFLSLPVVVKLSISAYVDLGLAFFTTASLVMIFEWIRRGFETKFLILAALLCGLGMGTKYNGIIAALLLSLFVPFLYSRNAGAGEGSFRRAFACGLLFVFVSGLVFMPWMVRNHV